MASNRIIKALSDFEHVRKRPTMYVGQVSKVDLKVPVIKDGYIQKMDMEISPAFYKLYDEVLGNAFDEAIRMNGLMKTITISFNSSTNEVVVTDTGGGFYKGTDLNDKTGRTNIETAFTMLKAGSNFDDTREEEVIGTNGVGVSLVNMLSDEFEVTTINTDFVYKQKWTTEDWESNKLVDYHISPRKKEKLGTTVRFIPNSELFTDNKWDKEYVHTLLTFKNFVIKNDPLLSKLKFVAYFDGVELDLNTKFLNECFTVNTPICKIWLYTAKENGMDISFVNGQMCEGIYQKMINDYLNTNVFNFQYAHWYYNTFITLNLKPANVRFADQNKTKFAVAKSELEPILDASINKLKNVKGTNIFNQVSKLIEEYEKINAVKELKRARKKEKTNDTKFVSKYYPASGKKEYLFISEGLSSAGGITESRDPRTMGVYALKGKIKNTRTVSDLTNSAEIIQLMNVLDLDLDKQTCAYDKIIIAVDADPDGQGHISPLLINFFIKWFPWLVDDGRVYILQTPIITALVGGRLSHFYNKELFYKKEGKITEKNYIKGLGALSASDWKLIFKKMQLYKITKDIDAESMLSIAFGSDAMPRKKWLEN